MERPSQDARLVVGCKAGDVAGRRRPCWSRGVHAVVEQKAGYEGAGPAEPGWRPKGLPTSTQASADHTYEGIRSGKP